ncbi:hypothetical protein [Pseudoalteromonas sp. C12FD-1]|uniref:hypothetical protein n=1 Tax=Pseudoalteromonas sp. C12FD-1 TaxID=3131979 RepID=UPI00307D5B0E
MGKELDIYKLHKPDRTYDIIDLDIVSMADQIAEENNLSFREAVILAKFGFPSGKTKIADIVTNGFSCKVEKEALKQAFDVNLFANYLILNHKAYNALGKYLKVYGEFIPLRCDRELILFNPLVFEGEDETLTKKAYLNGIEDGLKSLSFKTDKHLVFKSYIQGGTALYCNAAFKSLVNENNLSGLSFNSNLVSIFA